MKPWIATADAIPALDNPRGYTESSPLAAAERWSMLLDRRANRVGRALEFTLDPGLIRFVGAVDQDGTGVVGMDIRVKEPGAILAKARDLGLPVDRDAVTIGGVAIWPVKP